MKIVHINTTQKRGGAARAVYRLHKELLIQNVKSKMIVQQKQTKGENVIRPQGNIFTRFIKIIAPKIDKIPYNFFLNHLSNHHGPHHGFVQQLLQN